MGALTECPACGHDGLDEFYRIDNVPVHSCLMLNTRQEAEDFPKGDVRLALCDGCGFIFNLVFDTKWSAYAPNYEDQQSFSPTFNSFAGTLAKELVHRHNLFDKNIIEVGCSKGDFLALLCEFGRCHGVGIDPSAVAGRVESPAMKNIRFINEYYNEEHIEIPADFICCRHTLEHIQPVYKFMSLLKNAASTGTKKTVMVEIPDMKRVLETCAFEDIYYEHCSYFTPGTYARLFRNVGFDISDLRLEYDDQYLIAELGIGDSSVSKEYPIEESVAETKLMVAKFKNRFEEKCAYWTQYFSRMEAENRKVAIWGSGSKCVSFLTTLGLIEKVDVIVDINPNRQGKFAPGLSNQIKSPKELVNLNVSNIIIMNSIYKEEIQRELTTLGCEAEIVTL